MEAVTQKCCRGAPTLRVISCERKNCQHFCDLFSLQFSHHYLPVPSAFYSLIISLFLCHLNAQTQNNQNYHLVAAATYLHWPHCNISVFLSVLKFTNEHYIVHCSIRCTLKLPRGPIGQFYWFLSYARKIQNRIQKGQRPAPQVGFLTKTSTKQKDMDLICVCRNHFY